MIYQGHTINATYLEFDKAYDSLNYKLLLVKMKSFVVSEVEVHSNAQWCFAGPLLSLLFVTDLPDALKTLTLLFANDVKMGAQRAQKIKPVIVMV